MPGGRHRRHDRHAQMMIQLVGPHDQSRARLADLAPVRVIELDQDAARSAHASLVGTKLSQVGFQPGARALTSGAEVARVILGKTDAPEFSDHQWEVVRDERGLVVREAYASASRSARLSAAGGMRIAHAAARSSVKSVSSGRTLKRTWIRCPRPRFT